ncbi:MAG: hypothetical protein ACRDE2_17925, partial [Chitinophagaceae bacterium]
MDKTLISEIIKKFLEGDCTDEEFAYLLYWYESFDENIPSRLTDEEKELLRVEILRRIRRNIPELQLLEKEPQFIKMKKGKNLLRR